MTDAPDRGFTLDPFQQQAIDAFDAGESVLVAAPTGSGKTVIAEHGIEKMMAAGSHTFYTSPIKALANQKFRDFGERFGVDNVGLLTGDVTINGHAPIVIMTTEVLRNMLYEGARRLRSLGCVVLDEVHYLQDRDRGPVWEEVLLNLPADVRTISLSATVSNLDEFVEWLRSVRGPTTLIVERTRPVPLKHLVAVGDRESRTTHVEPLLHKGKLAPDARRFRPERKSSRDRNRSQNKNRRGGRPKAPPKRWAPPRRSQLVRQLIDDDSGPLIWFIFSRAGCDEAVDQCLKAGLVFTSDDEYRRLIEILNECTADIDDDAWYSLELDRWQDAFEAGISSHHAGLIPAVKQAVEIAFAEGLISVVFATETLALGVNLPARTVILERLVKYDGQDHKPLTPMEFTQLTGRAGRRGLDVEGTAVSCWNTRLGLDEMAELAASVDYPLRSAFAPNYNMVANLVRRSDQESARRFVSRSFAQFQTDSKAVREATRNLDLEKQLAAAERAAQCDHGDVVAWLADRKAAKTADDEELGQLRPGAVITDRGGAVVLSVAHRGGGVVTKLATHQGELITVRAGQIASPIAVLGVAQLPKGLSPTDPTVLAWAREELENEWTIEEQGIESCPRLESHLRGLREVHAIELKLERQRVRTQRRQSALERRFDSVAEILHDTGFANGWELTDKGDLLTMVHGASEIVLAEALHEGTLKHLDPPALAAALSSLVYESRRGEPESFKWPSKAIRHAVTDLRQRAIAFRTLELQVLDDTLTREPDPALVAVVHGWAMGKDLDEVLPESMTGGDFVRRMRQLIDVCRQIAQTDTSIAETAGEAVFCIDRGVVRSRRDLFIEQDAENDAGDDQDDVHGIDDGEPETLDGDGAD